MSYKGGKIEHGVDFYKRRLREAETMRDYLLHQLIRTVEEIDKYMEMIEEAEDNE